MSDFEWLKKTFEENDAGFQYMIDKKGHVAYSIHNQDILEKVKVAETPTECTRLLHEWLSFFRSGHIGIESLGNEQQFLKMDQKTGIWNGNISEFEKIVASKKEVDYEGIWETGEYKIGIKKEGSIFIGFIIESDVDGWRDQGRIKLKIEQNKNNWKSTYYMRDYSIEERENPELTGNNYLQIGQWLLKRISPVFPEDQLVDKHFERMNALVPYLEKLNKKTLYMRIPSFHHNAKFAIDNVLAANKEMILNTENLIIDIRNGTGGSDISYFELLPFIYTNPMREVSVEFLSTERNNKRMLDLANNPEYRDIFDEVTRQQFKKDYERMQGELGKFVNLSDKEVDIIQFDTIYAYPKNIGIIINGRNASTDENFLLVAKQSKKVKLFGVTTFGSLDVSNMYYVDSPSKNFRLHYCLSRSLRIPGMEIDEIGIQPDYYLDKSIPSYKWVDFVNDILNK
ncbi:MAG: S41 family peptidase [Tannerella sp.]|jgi:hypothetical protein|nr:S41 family peptidase [Tannerella sp.]